MTITIAEVLKKIDNDLAWRGPNDRSLGYVCLARDQAEYLRNWVITLINERDDLVAEKEARDGSNN